LGSFGGLYDISKLKNFELPVLVGSTDGVGTKIKLASQLRTYDTIGHDIVNHCTNDILVQGAVPLFFLDYVAASKIDPVMISTVVRGIANACIGVGCALIGGETAEMPGVYLPNEFDLAGTIVGVVERKEIIDGSSIEVGDVVIGIKSSGLHTNGFSLARKVFEDYDMEQKYDELDGKTLGQALLASHRPYLNEFLTLKRNNIQVKGMAHITGGGLIENPPRILPNHVSMEIQRGSWKPLPIFDLIQSAGNVTDMEMARVFNMGLGMLIVIPANQAKESVALINKLSDISDDCSIVGRIIPRVPGSPVTFCGDLL